MEELVGKQRMHEGNFEMNGVNYSFELYLDPNEPGNCRILVLNRPGKDSVIAEYDSAKEDVHKVIERLI